eukprot:6106021-Amphidinium_carterae.1
MEQQGDPLSAMAFAITIEVAFRRLETMFQQQQADFNSSNLVHAYMDDTVLGIPQQSAEAVMHSWQHTLQGMGMELQVAKTIINQP